MKSCRHFQQNIPDYVAGRLSSQDMESVRQHTQTCETCSLMLNQEADIRALFAKADTLPDTPELWNRVVHSLPAQKTRFAFSRIWLYGSGLVTATAASLMVFTMTRTPPIMRVGTGDTQAPTVEKPHSYATMLNDVQNLGMEENKMFISASHSVSEVATRETNEGDVQ